MGRARKPTVIRALEGNRGHRPLPPGEPIGKGRPRMPDYLSAEARELYADIVASLPEDLLTRADESTLERAATAWAQFREATRQVNASGLLIKGLLGAPVKNPLLTVQKQAAQELEACSAGLGLSPAARARISAPEHVDDDPLEQLFGGDNDNGARAN
jgi:P27 family predicted phage terminase small subunit